MADRYADTQCPLFTICLGHEIIGAAFRAKIKRLNDYQSRKERVMISVSNDPIFDGIEKTEIFIQKKHRFHIPVPPPDFEVLAYSEICPVEIMRHKEQPIYGFQGHPEVSGDDGLQIMKNFLAMCQIISDE